MAMGRVVRIPVTVAPSPQAASEARAGEEAWVDWQDRALRLQADMESYRRRQQRLAQEQAAADRERLLRAFLQVTDNLERALAARPGGSEELRQGVQLTQHAALRMLETEGVEPIAALGQPFDPAWHEAVCTVSGNEPQTAPGTVVQVIETGFRLGDQLLRPAKVVVAA